MLGVGHYTLCDKHGVHIEHGLNYEYLVSTSNVLLFGKKLNSSSYSTHSSYLSLL